jgi:hypothetical protein
LAQALHFQVFAGCAAPQIFEKGMFSRKNVRTKRLIFRSSGFRRVLPVFFGCNLRWNARDQWSLVSGHWSVVRDQGSGIGDLGSEIWIQVSPVKNHRPSRVNCIQFPGVDSSYYDETREITGN